MKVTEAGVAYRYNIFGMLLFGYACYWHLVERTLRAPANRT